MLAFYCGLESFFFMGKRKKEKLTEVGVCLSTSAEPILNFSYLTIYVNNVQVRDFCVSVDNLVLDKKKTRETKETASVSRETREREKKV